MVKVEEVKSGHDTNIIVVNDNRGYEFAITKMSSKIDSLNQIILEQEIEIRELRKLLIRSLEKEQQIKTVFNSFR